MIINFSDKKYTIDGIEYLVPGCTLWSRIDKYTLGTHEIHRVEGKNVYVGLNHYTYETFPADSRLRVNLSGYNIRIV